MSNADYITNQDIMLLLAKRIKEYRLAARMSQKEMAEKSGVSLATISHFEQGVNQNMTLNNFISLLPKTQPYADYFLIMYANRLPKAKRLPPNWMDVLA